MSKYLNVNIHNDSSTCLSEESSPTSSPRLARDFATLRVVSEESMTVPEQSSIDSQKEVRDAPPRPEEVSALQALAQLCAAQQDTKKDANATAADLRISQNDVLCGRGGLTNHHSGNVFFRQLVRMKQESYLLASKREKAGVAHGIVDLIRKLNPPGRFLKKNSNGVWVEIGDRKAREKTSQALREGAPELRSDLQQNRSNMLTIEQQFQQQQLWSAQQDNGGLKIAVPCSTNNNTGADFNRSRIVSDDSIGAGYSHFLSQPQDKNNPPEEQQQPHLIPNSQQQPQDAYAGTKRSHEEACAVQEQSTERGPRLKLFKSRMQFCM